MSWDIKGERTYARDYAVKKHGDQKYGDRPYSYHLDKVANVCREFGLPEMVISAAYLHDVLEDTETEFSEIASEFGDEVATLVYAVTDEGGVNRRERHNKTKPKYKANVYALPLKLCDRIANVRESKINNDSLFNMYKKEHRFFINMKDDCLDTSSKLWEELDGLFK